MRQPGKRDADEAFDNPDDTKQARKRSRRRKKRSHHTESQRYAGDTPAFTEAKRIPSEALIPGDDSSKACSGPAITKIATIGDIVPQQSTESHPVTNEASPSTEQMRAPSKRKRPHRSHHQVKSRKTDDESQALTLRKEKVIVSSPSKSEAKKKWSLSSAAGGLFLDQDPILTQDSKYLILPTKCSVNIYSTSTSLLVRILSFDPSHEVTSCVLSPSEPTEILVSTYKGELSKWDWTAGRKIQRWRLQRGLIRILGFISSGKDANERVLTVQRKSGDLASIVEYALNSEESPKPAVILTRKLLLGTLRSFEDGRILVLCADDNLILAHLNGTKKNTTETNYILREVKIPGQVISMDARERRYLTGSGNKRFGVDVVLGCHNGAILVYDDLLNKLMSKEKSQKAADILGRRLVWHRDVVNTVKWSRDGNYLISGGNETVLVIWQLDTNEKQFLPHLTSSVLNLTISEPGSSYAIQLADNSVMVLSTADLLPSANVTGLAISKAHGNQSPPAAFHPHNANLLLLAAPVDVGYRQFDKIRTHSTMLQTYDLQSSLQTGKQALTRNLTTSLNHSPAGHRIEVPNVVHMQVSHDGNWLATVDQWLPPKTDMEALYPLIDQVQTSKKHLEICLRFWKWSEEGKGWELVTRVDEPHPNPLGAVLGLVACPSRLEVATIGADGSIRIWHPKSRSKNGVPVRDQSGQQLYTWACSLVVQPEKEFTIEMARESLSAALCYSEDGSVLAASWSLSSTGPRNVHFVDPIDGTTRLSQPNILSQGNGRLEFLGKDLVCLSKQVCVWDTVASKARYFNSLSDYSGASEERFLAVNHLDGTFAIALNHSPDLKVNPIMVFNIHNLQEIPLASLNVPSQVRILLPAAKAAGFVVFDSDACYRQLLSPYSSATMSTLPEVEREEVTKSLDNVFGSSFRQAISAEEKENKTGMLALPEPGQVADYGSLEEVIASQSTSKGRVSEMFEKVARFFARASVA